MSLLRDVGGGTVAGVRDWATSFVGGKFFVVHARPPSGQSVQLLIKVGPGTARDDTAALPLQGAMLQMLVRTHRDLTSGCNSRLPDAISRRF